MTTFTVPLAIDRGADFDLQVTWQSGTPPGDTDLTGCTALAHIRSAVTSPTVLAILSTANGEIILGGTAGTIQILIPAATTAGFTWPWGVYDMLITFPSGAVRKLLSGTVVVTPGVTHA